MINESQPPQKLSYALFRINELDNADEQTQSRTKHREISVDDPFMGDKPRFRRLHQSVHRTEDLITKLEPFESRHFTDQRQLKRICDLESRFYNSKEQQVARQLTLVN